MGFEVPVACPGASSEEAALWAAPKPAYVECALFGGTLFFKLACKSLCSFQGLGILFYLDLRLALLWHQKAFMTVKTRNEKYRPGIREAASCQAYRGLSGGQRRVPRLSVPSPQLLRGF